MKNILKEKEVQKLRYYLTPKYILGLIASNFGTNFWPIFPVARSTSDGVTHYPVGPLSLLLSVNKHTQSKTGLEFYLIELAGLVVLVLPEALGSSFFFY